MLVIIGGVAGGRWGLDLGFHEGSDWLHLGEGVRHQPDQKEIPV